MHDVNHSVTDMRYRLPIALTALLSMPALADTPVPPSYPRLEYRSALADFVPYRETGLADWHAVNDVVERLGGHMGHAGHVQAPAGGHEQSGRDASDRPISEGQGRGRP